jgi:late competence protein required for DNA uptake (superfamily II DNA/RNA helicase)
VLEAGRSAILLVPEIGLTPAVAADLHQLFGDEVAILHSALSDKERAEQWRRIKRGEARMVVGTRSAVFAPVSDLALVIVDEEQDPSYKQEEMPRYHARDVAVMRAKMANAAVVLGSATPSLESYFNAKKGKYKLLELPDRVEQRPLPEVEIIDMRQEFQETGSEQVISHRLAEEIKERLERRGIFAGSVVPGVRQDAGVQELRHRHDPSQALSPHGMPLLRVHRTRAQGLHSLRQRVCLFPRHRVGETGRIAARNVSAGTHRTSGPRYGARPRRLRTGPERSR